MLNKILEKAFDKFIDFIFEPIWGRIIMLVASPSLSVYLAWAYEPLFLWFAGLAGFGFILWIINQTNYYRNNKKDKKFNETFLKFKISNNPNNQALIEVEKKKNIDHYFISDFYYDNSDNPIIILSIVFIKPIYSKPRPTSLIRGDGNSHAISNGISFYEEKNYIYNITSIIKGVELNSTYVFEVKQNED